VVRKMISKLYSYFILKLRGFKSRIRVAHFRLLGISIGKGCYIDTGVIISGNVSIGDGCSISSNSYIGTALGGRVEIGNRCHIGKMNQIGSSGSKVVIADDCIFAPFVSITDGIHAFKDKSLIIKNSPILTSSIEIGANVWLGSEVMVMQGVEIGEGAVIGAKALVKNNIPANAVAVGIPAKVIYYRGEADNAEFI
jgi:acetyltransferase-like isoleucine patch superfamily enzyme